MSTSLGLETCPKCGADSIFLPLIPAAGYNGRLYGSRSEGFCNSPICDQLLWYYPRSGRVTRRNVGQTLADYHAKQRMQYANLRHINIMRRHMDLPPLMEVLDGLWSRAPVDEPALSRIARLRRMPVEWFWWIVAALRSPFLGNLPPSSLSSGYQTINRTRIRSSVEVDNAE